MVLDYYYGNFIALLFVEFNTHFEVYRDCFDIINLLGKKSVIMNVLKQILTKIKPVKIFMNLNFVKIFLEKLFDKDFLLYLIETIKFNEYDDKIYDFFAKKLDSIRTYINNLCSTKFYFKKKFGKISSKLKFINLKTGLLQEYFFLDKQKYRIENLRIDISKNKKTLVIDDLIKNMKTLKETSEDFFLKFKKSLNYQNINYYFLKKEIRKILKSKKREDLNLFSALFTYSEKRHLIFKMLIKKCDCTEFYYGTIDRLYESLEKNDKLEFLIGLYDSLFYEFAKNIENKKLTCLNPIFLSFLQVSHTNTFFFQFVGE